MDIDGNTVYELNEEAYHTVYNIRMNSLDSGVRLLRQFANKLHEATASCKGCDRPKVGSDCVCKTCSRYWRDNYIGEQN